MGIRAKDKSAIDYNYQFFDGICEDVIQVLDNSKFWSIPTPRYSKPQPVFGSFSADEKKIAIMEVPISEIKYVLQENTFRNSADTD